MPWIFEIVAWLPALRNCPSAKYFFEIVNLLNSLRGIFIFVLFILLRPSVFKFLIAALKETFASEKEKQEKEKEKSTKRASVLRAYGGPTSSAHSTSSTVDDSCSSTNHSSTSNV